MENISLVNLGNESGSKTIVIYQQSKENENIAVNFDDFLDIDINEALLSNFFDHQLVNQQILKKLSTEKSFKLEFEQFLLLDHDGFFFLLKTFGYNSILVRNNLYSMYFPMIKNDLYEDLAYYIEDTKEHLIQSLFSEYLLLGDRYVASYSNYSIDAFNSIIDIYPIKEVMFEESCTSTTIDYEIDSRLDVFASIIGEVIEQEKKNITIAVKKDLTPNQKESLYILSSHFGVKVSIAKFEIASQTVENDDYLNILQRRNSKFSFFDLDFYRYPGENLETIKINQSYIIDRIVKNAEDANAGGKYNDIFVTASTGAGKSLMFQIPSIYLAEKHNILTIVITPLIGLMNDQIENIGDLTKEAATINSDYTPHEKDSIKDSIKAGNISILYISPEALLSNGDITNLIGDRKIGLIIIDEAHIVATWGKSFRPDYWFLGDYINYLRTKSTHIFPIATFSATVSYGGSDDMHSDIIDSLKMRTKNDEYIGPVRRDDISFDIVHHQKKSEYRREKETIVKNSLEDLLHSSTKTVAYFPYISHINNFYSSISKPQLNLTTSTFHSKMHPEDKKDHALNFKTGSSKLMLATKAFGMGIDINDIEVVYHFAPTGNLMDYIQEIGRSARDKEISGIAKIDFFEEDFSFTKALFGMSSIKNYQVVMTLKKIRDIYSIKKRRNFTISSSDFNSIFTRNDRVSLDDVDAKLKTALLLIQKDFELDPSVNYKPIIFKPRSLFTFGYVLIDDKFLKDFTKSPYKKHFKIYKDKEELSSQFKTQKTNIVYDNNHQKIVNSTMTTRVRLPGDIYRVNFKSMWEEEFSDMTFGQFKRSFYIGDLPNFSISKEFIPEYLVTITAINKTNEDVVKLATQFIDSLIEHFDTFDSTDTKKNSFKLNDLVHSLKEFYPDFSETNIELVAHNVILGLNLFNGNYKRGLTYNTTNGSYQVNSHQSIKKALNSMKKTIRDTFNNVLNGNSKSLLVPFVKGNQGNTWLSAEGGQTRIFIVQFLESISLVRYEVKSGESPEYFIRLNGTHQIDKILENSFYQSKMVRLAHEKHTKDVSIQRKFFTELAHDKERWDFVEKYFAGLDTDI